MFTGLGALLGMISGSVPKVLEHFQDKKDKAHELALMREQAKLQRDQADRTLQAQTVIASEESYRASLKHDAAAGRYEASTGFGRFAMDVISVWRAAMRPAIVSLVLVQYSVIKGFTVYGLIQDDVIYSEIIAQIWTVFDAALLEACIGYYITNRGIEKRDKTAG